MPSAREHQTAKALVLARQLATEFPDNSRFQVDYAKLCFDQDPWPAAKATAQTIPTKNSQGLVGYEALAGRIAAYSLGYLQQHRYHDLAQAKYYRRCLVFSETSQLTTGYYVFASTVLGDLAAQRQEVATARRYYALVLAQADHSAPEYQPARAYLRRHSLPAHP
jgi:hypothetical protein